jgi:hypothetical protein
MSLDPEAAAAEMARVDGKVRRSRWWHVTGAVIMAVFTFAFYTTTTAWPETIWTFGLPTLLVTSAMLAFVGWRRRAIDRTARRLEEPAVWASLGLAVVTITLKFFLRPEGLTPLVIVMGALPAIPFVVVAWRIARA